jgi:HPt (histidine-containing phosphotransfer) domain-containing protein
MHLSKPISKEKLIGAIEQFRPNPTGAQNSANHHASGIQIPEGFEELSKTYIAKRNAELPQMFRAAAGGNFDSLQTLGHNMKGTGTSYGFPELTALGAAIESAAKEGDGILMLKQLHKTRDYVEYAVQTLQ